MKQAVGRKEPLTHSRSQHKIKEREGAIRESTSPAHFGMSDWEHFRAGVDPSRMGEGLKVFVCHVGFVNSEEAESCVGSCIQGGFKN